MFAVAVGEFLAGLHRHRRDVLLRAPGERLRAIAAAELRRDVARRLSEDPAVAELIHALARRHAGRELAARAGRGSLPARWNNSWSSVAALQSEVSAQSPRPSPRRSRA